ncbi:hypothetical protein PFISCL1PPCAC_14989 [Pristionchus fissidentatus]|uniref:Uncharacterized protein n=1 Tax=Pristionchus fissidentatus TaxID=1538716 RepID=A0AAV5VVP7_9BILA|nr:hypothetical protein PFISCL1PPCAC_14989 [Pristionchus fissidentatus]
MRDHENYECTEKEEEEKKKKSLVDGKIDLCNEHFDCSVSKKKGLKENNNHSKKMILKEENHTLEEIVGNWIGIDDSND